MKSHSDRQQALYQPHQFARKAGVTVRTLHFYDHLGLLKPSDHTGSGFRLYSEADLPRLQQIVTLKFIGFSLREIRRLLSSKGPSLAAALKLQRMTLAEKRRQLDSVIEAIAKAETVAVSGNTTNWEAFRKIIQEIQAQSQGHWLKDYYSEEARKLLSARAKAENWTAEHQAKVGQEWQDLIQRVRRAASRGVDPGGSAAQALSERWLKLMTAFTGGNPAIEEGLEKLYADPNARRTVFRMPLDEIVSVFIAKALRIYGETHAGSRSKAGAPEEEKK
jgi:DNA-binding transcriptional MerR regulator